MDKFLINGGFPLRGPVTGILAAFLCLPLCACVGYRNHPASEVVAAAEPAPPVSFTYDDFQKLKAKRTFTSHEELLQLFYEILQQDSARNLRLDRDVIQRIAKEVHTFFPIGACEEITLRGSRLQLAFRENQVAPIPLTFGQVSMSFSKVLVFRVAPVPEDPATLRFQVESGGVRVNTSWLAKLVSPFAADIQGSAVTYKLDTTRRCSIGGIEQHRVVGRECLNIHPSEKEVLVDVRDEDPASSGDLRYRPDECREFGVLTRIGKGDEIAVTEDKPKVDHELAARIRRKIASILKDPEEAFKKGVRQDTTARYNLETHDVDFNWSFHILGLDHG